MGHLGHILLYAIAVLFDIRKALKVLVMVEKIKLLRRMMKTSTIHILNPTILHSKSEQSDPQTLIVRTFEFKISI